MTDILKPYSALAEHYEYLIDCDYENWSQYLYNQIKTYAYSAKSGIDAGCGSGYFTRELAKFGYAMHGFDISEKMLSEAYLKSVNENLKIFYTQQDIRSAKTTEKADFVTAVNDVINYVKKEDLVKAFKSVKNCLNIGGVFIFDISTEYKLKNILGSNTFAEDTDKISYIWTNNLQQDYVIMDLAIFKKIGSCYNKFNERHIQYIHSQKDITEKIAKSGLKLLKAESFLGGEIKADTERILFVCGR